MTEQFQPSPFLTGYFEPFRAEIDAPDLVIEGTVPEDLHGTFYRNGPDPQFPPHPDDTYHVFDGDGMIYAFHIEGGKISMKNRWVRTPKFELEREAGRRLFGVFNNPAFNDPDVDPGQYDTANTHIWPHGGKLFALMEGCPATELHPDTLETIGYNTFDDAANGPFTAHPKTDPVTGELFTFGWAAKGPGTTDLRFNILDKSGKPTKTEWLHQPYCSMMHDLWLTENYVIFPCMPVTVSLERVAAGKPVTAWESDKPAAFGVMPRYGTADEVVWIEADPTFMFHSGNSFERGDEIVVDVAGSKRAPLMPDVEGNLPSHQDTRFTTKRWVINPKTGSFREEEIDAMDLQFPRIDDRYQGRAYRHSFFNGSTSPEAGRLEGFDAVARLDAETGSRVYWSEGNMTYIGEPVFAPKKDSIGEGDGWLMCIQYDPKRGNSHFLIFDALHLEDGPVARAHAPVRVPGGFHCHYRDLANAA